MLLWEFLVRFFVGFFMGMVFGYEFFGREYINFFF